MDYGWIAYGALALCFLIQLFYCKTRRLGIKGLVFILFFGSGILAALSWLNLGITFQPFSIAVSLGLGMPGLILLLFGGVLGF